MNVSTSAVDFAQRCGGAFLHKPEQDIRLSGLAIDSRQVRPGDLFAAIRGARVDGHDYIAAAANVGAAAALVSHPVEHELPQIIVSDVESGVADFGAMTREAFGGNVIGITGSAGKTTAKNLIAAVLAEAGAVIATEGNQNNELGVPLTLAKLKPSTEFAVIEMGAGKPGDIARLQKIVRPTLGVLLNVSTAHLAHYASVDDIAETKSAILADLPTQGVAIFNGDEPWAEEWRRRAGDARTITFGLSEQVDIRAVDVSYRGFSGSQLKVNTPLGAMKLALHLPGRQGVMNALAAVAVAFALGISESAIARGLSRVRPAVGRGQQLLLGNDITLVDDCYNANPMAVKAAIDVLACCGGPRYLVLGSMLELGPDSAVYHADIGRYAKEKQLDGLWVIGDLARPALGAFGRGGLAFASNEAFLDQLPAIDRGATVLVKGSRGALLDAVVQGIVNKVGG